FENRPWYHRGMNVPSNTRKTQYIAGLHTLRIFAALSVVVSHVHQFIPGWFLIDVNTGILRNFTLTGGSAVILFYVLSGFLLTLILHSEKQRRDTIDVKRFYRRRMYRIAPAYYLVLAITAAVSIATAPDYAIVFGRQFNAIQFPATVLFATYIPLALNTVSGMVSHFWSLGVEVAFYALIPWLVRARRVPLALTLVIVVRLLILALTPFDSPIHQIALYLKVDSLAIGGLFAWLWIYRRDSIERTLTTLPGRIGVLLACAVIIVVELPSHNVVVDYAATLVSGWLILNISAGH